MTISEAKAREFHTQQKISETLEAIARQQSNIVTSLERVADAVDKSLDARASSVFSIPDQYKLFREYVEHEDGLINNRLLWNINIQGFLFATYGFSVQKLAEIQAHIGPETIGANAMYWFMGVLPVFGAVISYFSYKGVVAAQYAIDTLNRRWKGIMDADENKDYKAMLPELIGGGDKKAHGWGFLAPKLFPWIVVGAWAVVLLSYGYYLRKFWTP